MAEVLVELQAQLMWFFNEFGRNPTHVDGHNHIHVLPGVSAVVVSLCLKRSIRWIRMPLENMESVLEDRKQEMFCTEVVKNAKAARTLFASCGLRMADVFAGMNLSGKVMSRDRILKVLDRSSCRRLCCYEPTYVEIMTHPGYPSRTGDSFSRSFDRLHELRVLTDPKLMTELMRKCKLSPFPRLGRHGLQSSPNETAMSSECKTVPLHFSRQTMETEIQRPVQNVYNNHVKTSA
uniref:Carbohydrate deacetylase n=2 Tax=Lotharella globosa TaxID=91324 RepID=A0A7S3Y9V5_9EUKA